MSWRSLALAVILAAALALTCSAQQSLPAQQILSQIAAGQPVHYDGIDITGNLDLSTLPESQIPATIALVNCTIPIASFEGITFDQDAFFWGSSFGNASFDKATFSARSDFVNASFRQASFAGCTFYQPALFDGALFEKDVSFVDASFGLDAFFNNARFLGRADFNYSDFDSYSYFAAANFSGDAFFSDVDLSAASDFSLATFSAEANFIRSRLNEPYFGEVLFSGPAQFGLARFSDAAYFSGTRFQDLALFGLARFEDIVTFQEARFQGDLNFKAATISSLLFEKAELSPGSRIILNDTEINLFRAHWDEIQDHVAWQPGAYLALVENYRRLGWSKDEDDCYYQYRRLDQAGKSWGWSKIIDILAWLSCGYGVRPGYAVIWSLITILFFALLFWMGDGIRRSSKPLSGPAEEDSIPERVTLRNALFFSTMIFLSQGPIDFLPVRRHRYYVILEGILGWLLLALFLVTLGRVMIR